MGSSSENRPFFGMDLTEPGIENLGGPLVEYVDGNGWRFTSTWVHYYFAALDSLRKIERSKNKNKTANGVLRDLSALFERGEYQKIQAREILSALLHEARNNDHGTSELIRGD